MGSCTRTVVAKQYQNEILCCRSCLCGLCLRQARSSRVCCLPLCLPPGLWIHCCCPYSLPRCCPSCRCHLRRCPSRCHLRCCSSCCPLCCCPCCLWRSLCWSL